MVSRNIILCLKSAIRVQKDHDLVSVLLLLLVLDLCKFFKVNVLANEKSQK